MKFKTTKKAISNGYNKIIKIGYCGAQNLLAYEDTIAYSTGQYGWACDYFDINGILISTGYSPIGSQVDYDLITKYEDLARDIRSNYNLSWDERKQAVQDLLRQFVAEVTA